MKKYLLMFSCALLMTGTAHALTAEEQLKAMKDVFLKEFNAMDKNHDNMISRQEFMSYQFDSFRSNVMSATGFDDTSTLPEVEVTKKTESKVVLGGVSPALQEMADYKLDDEDGIEPLVIEESTTSSEKIDLSLSEDESLKKLLSEMEEKENTEDEEKKEEVDQESKEKQLSFMMETIKKSLPKKIDETTTWTDIEYANSTISYIYQANVDIEEFSDEEKANLTESIKNEACEKAYKDMCPKIKTMFIDDGINMQIRYYDKNNVALSSCEFNQITCK